MLRRPTPHLKRRHRHRHRLPNLLISRSQERTGKLLRIQLFANTHDTVATLTLLPQLQLIPPTLMLIRPQPNLLLHRFAKPLIS